MDALLEQSSGEVASCGVGEEASAQSNQAKHRSAGASYRALFRVKGVPSLVCAMVVARMPTGCISLLLVLLVGSCFGAAAAGMAASAWTIGTAVFAPSLGRAVDKGNGPATLRVTAWLQGLCVALLLVLVFCGLPVWAVVACSFACGATTPPVAGTTRSLWKVLVPEDLLSVAYSFEILLIDVLYVSGPLVASAFVAFDVPAIGIALTTLCLMIGSLALARSGAVRRYSERG